MEKKSFQSLSALLLVWSVVLENNTFFSRSFWDRLRAFVKPLGQLLAQSRAGWWAKDRPARALTLPGLEAQVVHGPSPGVLIVSGHSGGLWKEVTVSAFLCWKLMSFVMWMWCALVLMLHLLPFVGRCWREINFKCFRKYSKFLQTFETA